MRQTDSSAPFAEVTDAPQGVRLSEIALALFLAAGLLYTALMRGGGDSYVVSIRDLDTAIVLSLRNAETPPRDTAGGMTPLGVPPAPMLAVSLPTAAPPPTIGVRHGLASGLASSLASGAASVIGIASTYNPFRGGGDAVVASTASGEAYDPDSWTAAIQIDLRQQFGGVRFGRFYRPAFALVERGDKRAIVRINDVGPLRPGRVIDLNERSMRYFDPSLRLGLVHDMKITLLPGHDWTPGPVGPDTRIDLASAL